VNLALLANTETHVAGIDTAIFACLLVALITCLALEEKLHAKKSVIVGTFAIICLLLGAIRGILPFNDVVIGSHQVTSHQGIEGEHDDGHFKLAKTSAEEQLHYDGHRLRMPVYIPGIDWGVIAIILGSSLFVDVTSRSGLFTWIAIKVTKASRGDPLKLLFFYGFMTIVFSAVLNNVTAMIIIGSLTVVSLDKLELRDKLLGFLLIEGLLTNIGGLLTLVSSVPNIIVGTAANISFMTFFVKACPYVVVSTLVTLWLGARFFDIKRLQDEVAQAEAEQLVQSFDETDGIESWGFFWFGTGMLILFIIVIATTSVLPFVRDLEMGFVALAFAGIMLIRYRSVADDFYRSIDWDLIGFFMGLFIVIYVMEHAMVLHTIGIGLSRVLVHIDADPAHWVDSTVLLLGAAGFSSVTDNIPLAAMLANILKNLDAQIATATVQETGLWWSVIFGANLGGNLTPIGSASTLVAVTIMHKHKVHLSFAGFVKAALPFALLQIAMAVFYVLLILPYL
jgi:Na+/H+ antiporter NhaD/arsenite permease-like protein